MHNNECPASEWIGPQGVGHYGYSMYYYVGYVYITMCCGTTDYCGMKVKPVYKTLYPDSSNLREFSHIYTVKSIKQSSLHLLQYYRPTELQLGYLCCSLLEYFLCNATLTPLHFKGRYCTFYSTVFIWRLNVPWRLKLGLYTKQMIILLKYNPL